MWKLYLNPFAVLQCVVDISLPNSENNSNDLVGMPFIQIIQIDGIIERRNKNIQWKFNAEVAYLLWVLSDGLMDIIDIIEIVISCQ